MSDSAAQREARLSETEAELSRTKAACARYSQVIVMLLIPVVVKYKVVQWIKLMLNL